MGRLIDKGVTLIELMVAVAILIIVITALLSTFIYCMLLNQKNNNLVRATNDAQYVLEQIKGLDYANITNYAAPTFTNLNNETVTLTRNIGSDIANIMVNVTWNERQIQRNFSLTTRITKTQ